MKAIKTVCICIPCFNNELTIYETLFSIVNQTYKKIKIKVFDNASTDNSLDIVRSFIEKGFDIEIYQNNKTTSGEENFNRCIQYAEGDYTAIFHSDDVYENTIIEEQVCFLERTDCLAVATHAAIIDTTGKEVGERFIPNEIRKLDSYAFNHQELLMLIFKYGNFITCPSVLFSSSVLRSEIVTFRGGDFKSSSDLDVWLRISALGKFGFLNRKLVNYRLSEASYSFNLSKVRIEDHDMFLVLNHYLDKVQGDFKNTLKRRYTFLLSKDRVKTNFNRLVIGNYNLRPVYLFNMLKSMSLTFYHLKFLMISIVAKIVFILPFKSKIFKIRKKNEK